MIIKNKEYKVIILDDDINYLNALSNIVREDFEYVPFMPICDEIKNWEKNPSGKTKEQVIQEMADCFWRTFKPRRGETFEREYDAIVVDYYWSKEEENSKEGSGVKLAEKIIELYYQRYKKPLMVPVIILSKERDVEIRSRYDRVFIVKIDNQDDQIEVLKSQIIEFKKKFLPEEEINAILSSEDKNKLKFLEFVVNRLYNTPTDIWKRRETIENFVNLMKQWFGLEQEEEIYPLAFVYIWGLKRENNDIEFKKGDKGIIIKIENNKKNSADLLREEYILSGILKGAIDYKGNRAKVYFFSIQGEKFMRLYVSDELINIIKNSEKIGNAFTSYLARKVETPPIYPKENRRKFNKLCTPFFVIRMTSSKGIKIYLRGNIFIIFSL